MRVKTALIVQRYLTHYRLPLFESLRERLGGMGVNLELVVGQSTQRESEKRDSGSLEWAHRVSNRYWLGDRLCWQPIGPYIRRSDLVIVTQENKLLFNALLAVADMGPRTALWGHGRNLQRLGGALSQVSERYKRWHATRVDWWFAYTDLTCDILAEVGFPRERTTTLNNAIDTAHLQRDLASLDDAAVDELTRPVLLDPKAQVVMHLGSLNEDKRIDLLLAATTLLRQTLGGVELVMAGDGALRDMVRQTAETVPWVHWVGAVSGRAKAAWLRRSALLVNPAAVGLVVLDAFAAGRVLITSDAGNHGPEICYLKDQVNGRMVATDPQSIADAALHLLSDHHARSRLEAAARADAANYSIERMSQRFAEGICQALEAPKRVRTLI